MWRWAAAQMLFVPLPFLKAPFYIQSLTSSQEIAVTAVIHLIPCIPTTTAAATLLHYLFFMPSRPALVETLSPSVFDSMAA